MLEDRTEDGLGRKENLKLLDEPVELVMPMGGVRVNLKNSEIET